MSDAMTLYKLIVLYMLDRVDFPLLRTHVFDFILYKDYTDYFTLHQVLSDLIETSLVSAKTQGTNVYLTITPDGRSTLSYFKNRISDAIKAEIEDFYKERSLDLRNESAIQSEYYKMTGGDFMAHLAVKEKGESIIDITLAVPTAEAAADMCKRWPEKHQEIYAYLMKQLM